MSTPNPYSSTSRTWTAGLVLEGEADIVKAAHSTDLAAGTNFLGTGDPFGVTVDSLAEFNSDGLVNQGQPVILDATAGLVGIAMNSVVADDDNNVVSVAITGVIIARAFALDHLGAGAAISKYDPLYVNDGTVTADQCGVIQNSATNGVFLGWALEAVASGNALIPILVNGRNNP